MRRSLPSSDNVPKVHEYFDEKKVRNPEKAKMHCKHVPYKDDFYKRKEKNEVE